MMQCRKKYYRLFKIILLIKTMGNLKVEIRGSLGYFCNGIMSNSELDIRGNLG